MDPAEKRFLALARRARRAAAAPAADLPPGLATRVLATLRESERPPALPWERYSLRAVPLAATVAAGCLLYAWPAIERAPDEQALAGVMVERQLK